MLNYVFEVTDPAEVNSKVGNITMAFTVGATIGVIFSGNLASKIGRTKLLFLLEVVAFLVGLLHLVENMGVLLMTRMLSGLQSSMSAVMGAIVLKEMIPERYFGTGGVSGYLFLVVFLQFSYFVNPLLHGNKENIGNNWRPILASPMIFSVIRLVLLFCSFGYGKVESKEFWFEKFRERKEKEGLREHLTTYYKTVYSD